MACLAKVKKITFFGVYSKVAKNAFSWFLLTRIWIFVRHRKCSRFHLVRAHLWTDLYIHKIVLDHFFDRHQKKSYFIHFFKPGQNIMSLLKRNIQIQPPLSTDWHPFFLGLWNFFEGLKWRFPQKISTFFLLQSFVNTLDWVYRPLK